MPEPSPFPGRPTFLRIVNPISHLFEPPPPVEWRVQGLFTRTSVNIIVGNPGAKKSWLVTDLAVCVAMGKPWLGLPVIQQPVLFVDEEAGHQRLWSRFNRVLAGHQAAKDIPLHYITHGNYDLSYRPDAYDLAGHVDEVKAGLVIIDALADITGGQDENSVSSIGPVLAHLRNIAINTGAAVIVTHHTNKRGAVRGSSSISASVDHMFELESEPRNDFIILRTIKARDVIPIEIHAKSVFAPDQVHFERSEFDTQAIPRDKLNAVAFAIMDWMVEHNMTDTEEIMENVKGFSPATLRKNINELKLAGYIIRKDSGSQGTPAFYSMTEKGVEYMRQEQGHENQGI